MEASPLNSAAAVPALRGPTTLLRLQSDERLVTLTRRGNQSAYEVLVQRYQSRLLAFCRHMLGSKEDAEDVLQEVFANAFNAMVSDTRPINVRPWLYRIARNRSLNHLRRIQPIGVDTLDDRMADNGISAEDTAHKREEFRELLGDVRQLAETQRTALLLREIDALSYDQIAEAMDTTVPSVKSLLVRARVSLAEAAEARNLTCEEVREELGEVAETMRRLGPAFRRHVKECDRCAAFQTHLKANNRAMTAIFPLGPLIVLKKLLAHVTAGAGAGGAAVGSAAAGSVAGSVITTGVGAIATKTAAGLAAAALVTAGAVEVDHARTIDRASASDRIVASASMPASSPPSVGGPSQASAAARGPRGPIAAVGAPASTTSTSSSTTTTGTTTTGTTGTSTSTTGTTTTGTVTGTGTSTSTTTAPFSPTTTTTGPATPTTTTSTAPPVDSGTETVTLPEGAAGTTTTKPTTAAPSTSSTGGDDTPAPKATPGASGQLDTPKLGTTTSKRRTTKRRPKATTSRSTGSRSSTKRTRRRASSYRVTTTKKKQSSSKSSSAKKRSGSES